MLTLFMDLWNRSNDNSSNMYQAEWLMFGISHRC